MAAASKSCDRQAKKENRREQIAPVINFQSFHLFLCSYWGAKAHHLITAKFVLSYGEQCPPPPIIIFAADPRYAKDVGCSCLTSGCIFSALYVGVTLWRWYIFGTYISSSSTSVEIGNISLYDPDVTGITAYPDLESSVCWSRLCTWYCIIIGYCFSYCN